MSLDSSTRSRVGVLTRGSLGQGVEMKLDPARSVESVRAGTFVVVEGETFDFFSLITDLSIDAANEGILLRPPGADDELLRRVLQGSGTYATVSLRPQLMVPQGIGDEPPLPVKTVPAHFSAVGEATEDDVARVFGAEALDGGDRFFHVGTPLGMDTPVCLDLARFVERSNAVFGKTGTGKSFLTRLLLAGTIATGRAVSLVFDMHNEYGDRARQETDGDATAFVPGLRQLFGPKVQIFSLDPESTRRRGGSTDVELHLYADQVEPEDVLPLRETLNLNATATESAYGLKKQYGRRWLARLLEAAPPEVEQMAEETGAHPGSLAALRRKLDRLDGLPFFHLEEQRGKQDAVDELFQTLDAGRSVVLEFGRYNSLLVYLLVANVITRRLRHRYEAKMEAYEKTQNEADKPQQLLITVEEAHNFLGPETARETPFGKIAREMRKFFVSLLIVDQRPSGIDEEVLSQIGTKLVAQLNDEKDIAAALVGSPGAGGLRQILASLDSKQQALLLGHAVPMPITIRTRDYGPDLFAAVKARAGRPEAESAAEIQEAMGTLF
ncbi:ATP-binding protein [Rubrivirga litoralis]|uniref:ATP-binding protein n=1 Tax=Rubrivirga litoralis TaxID=3075598 RepID=A0ABU3BQK6_9BACT|nr:ATP-binding protein [Rubrivirga sp. F394]MDT0631574.1 ATP-binding protein [Rubrivirga sp. F394]